MKDRDAKMRERFLQREDDRILRKIDKQIKREKAAYREKTDKDEQMDEAYQILLNINAELEGRREDDGRNYR